MMRVYRFKNETSDKIWAIEYNSDRSRYRVFWGKYGSKLVEKQYDLSSEAWGKAYDKEDRKKAKGYELVNNGFINSSYQLVVTPIGVLPPPWDENEAVSDEAVAPSIPRSEPKPKPKPKPLKVLKDDSEESGLFF